MSINAQPFNPTFKLVGNLVEDQVLVYDSSENAFVNSTNTGGGAGAGFDAAVNEGTGLGVWKGSAGTTLQFKTLLGGSDITITESGDSLIIASTVTETMQTGTNLGTGTGIFDSKDGTTHALKFKSLAVGAGLTLTDDGAGTLTLVNTIAAGTSDADLTLSNLSDNATARTNLGVYSKTESDAKYHKHDDAFVPSANNTFDIGSSTLKYNDIYAETFQGTAVLADNLTTSGTTGQVLTYNGSSWAAADSFDGAYSSLSGKPTIPTAVSELTNDSGFVTTDTDTTYTAGSGLTLVGTEFSNTAPDQTVALTGSGATTITGTYPNFTIASTDTDTNTTYTAGTNVTISGANVISSTDTNTTYTSGDFTHNSLSGVSANEHIDWTTDQGSTNIHASNYTNTDTNTTYTAGTGLTLVGTEFQNTSPDQTVSLTGTGATTVTGTYPNFTIDSTNTNTPAGYNNTNWDTAFGWGDHSTQGYLTSITGSTLEALSNVSNVAPQADQHLTWNAITNLWTPSSQSAGSGGYQDSDARNAISVSGDLSYNATTGVISYTTPTDTDTTYTAGTGLTLVGTEFSNTAPDQTVALTGTGATTVTGTYPNFTIDSTDTNTPAGYNNTNWDTAFGWGDHSTAGYLTSETDSQTLSLTGTTLAITGGNNVDLGVLTIDDMADVNITSVSDGQFLKYNNVSGDWENETVTIPTLTSQLTNDAGFITSASTYDNTDVDSHLNQSNPTSGYVLSWNGSDYAWVSNGTTGAHYTDADARLAISGTTGLSYNNTTGVMALNATIDDLLDVNSTGAALNQVLKWNGTAWSPALDIDTTYTAGTNVAISGSNVISSTDTTYTNVSEFTNDSGYLVSGDLSGYAQTSSLATVATTGAYSDLSGTPSLYANSDVDSHLNQSNPTQNHVLSWDGSDYSWVAQSGGGSATDKIEEGNSSVEVIDGGSNGHVMFNTNGTDRWQVTSGGHILPEANDTYDIGSADKKVRDLYLGSNSLYIEDNTIKTLGTDLLFNDEDVMDYANLKNKPSIPAQNTGGTGIQVNAGVVSLDANLSNLSNVSSTSPNSGEVLKWDGSEWAPGTDLTSGSSAMNDLSDVDTTGITSGQYLQWNGSAFVASTVSGGGASAIDDLSDVDTTTSSPSNGDVLTWVQADSEWAPAAPSGGSGGGSAVEYFKVNYATNGNLTSITNATSGVSATILSATGGDVEISFSGTNYPPAGILIYGYAYSTNEYVIMPLNKDITTRKVAGGGSAGSPIAFGTMGSVDLTLKLRENDTGASRSFGTDTHAWIMFTVI